MASEHQNLLSDGAFGAIFGASDMSGGSRISEPSGGVHWATAHSFVPPACVPRSPSWGMSTRIEPEDLPWDVLLEALASAHEDVAEAHGHGTIEEIEAAEARVDRLQRVVDRHERKEDDHDFDDWSDVMWLEGDDDVEA